MVSDILNACVIGVGNMGKHHARVFSTLRNCHLIGVSDSEKSRAEEIAKQYGSRAFGDYKKMLSELKPDIVSIAVPTALHREIAVECLKYSHVLIEKPIALNTKEAKEIGQAAEKNNKKAMVGHIERFNPVVAYLKKYIKDNNESVLSLDFIRVGLAPPKKPTTGVLTDLAIHDIDLVRFLTGEEITNSNAVLKSFGLTNFEDHVHLFLETKNSSSSIVSNWINPRKLRRVIVTLQKSFLEVDLIAQEISIYEKNEQNSYREGTAMNVQLAKEEPLILELEAFVGFVLNNIQNPVTIDDATKTLSVAENILLKSKK